MSKGRRFTVPLGTARFKTIFLVQLRLSESELFSHFSSFDFESICTPASPRGPRKPINKTRNKIVCSMSWGLDSRFRWNAVTLWFGISETGSEQWEWDYGIGKKEGSRFETASNGFSFFYWSFLDFWKQKLHGFCGGAYARTEDRRQNCTSLSLGLS